LCTFSRNRYRSRSEIHDTPTYVLEGVTGISAPDDYTFVLTIEDPNPAIPFLVTNLALGITNSAVLKALASRAGLDLVLWLLRQLGGFVRLMQLSTRRDPGWMLRVVVEHQLIVDSVEARDEPAAPEALRAHPGTSEYSFA
jgi:hypothetical protein